MKEEFFNTKQIRMLGALTLGMVVIALASYAILNFQKVDFLNPMPATIMVTGEGEVLAVPDIGQFSFSVTASGESATVAQELSGTKINEIFAYLKEQGIEDKDIKTQNYNLYPKWRYEERICPLGSYCPEGERIQDGFEVSQTISVKVRNTEKSGALITGVGEKGATDISGIEFTVDDVEALQEEARAAAIEDAKAKAKVLAEQLGVRIVRLVSYYEEGNRAYDAYSYKAEAMDSAVSESFGGAVMPVGENSTVAKVSVTYQVK